MNKARKKNEKTVSRKMRQAVRNSVKSVQWIGVNQHQYQHCCSRTCSLMISCSAAGWLLLENNSFIREQVTQHSD